ncbi:MAG: pitrilysin family protein [Candidatus Omnitrophota bacterium]
MNTGFLKKFLYLFFPIYTLLFSVSSAVDIPNRKVSEFYLENGLTLICESVPNAEVVNFSLLIKTGSATEGRYTGTGITHLLEHLIFKGDEKNRLAAVVENAGGYTNAYTTHDYTLFTVTIPGDKWSSVLPALLRSVFEPSFTPDDLRKEREVVLREIARNEDEPAYQANRNLWQTAYSVHPYRFPISGHPDLLNQLQYEDVRSYHQISYSPDNAILAVAGPVLPEKIKELSMELSKTILRQFPFTPVPPEEPIQVGYREKKVPFPTRLVYLNLAYHIPGLNSPDTPALDILANILGYGKTSRLYQGIIKKGLAYSIDASSYTPRYPGLFTISCICAVEKLDEVQEAIRQEVEKITNGASAKEIFIAQKEIQSQLLFNLQTMEGRTSDLSTSCFLTGNPLYSRIYLRSSAKVEKEGVIRVAQKYLRQDNLSVSMVGPASLLAAAPVEPETVSKAELPWCYHLKNNIPLLVKEDPDLPIVHFAVLLKGGLLFENSTANGTFPLLAELLTAGTMRKSAENIAREVAGWGGSLSTYSGNNSFGLLLDIPAEYWKEGILLIAEILQEAGFPENELSREKKEILGGIISRDERPLTKADQILRQTIFGSHPYGLPEGGTEESIGKIDRSIVLKTYQRVFGSNNLVITVFGDIAGPQVKDTAESLFNRIKPVRITEPAVPSPVLKSPVTKKEPSNKKESAVLIGFPGISLQEEKNRAILEILAEILNGQEGLLFQNLREKEPLVYSTGFSYFLGLQPGTLSFYAECQPDKTERVQQIVTRIITQLTKETVSEPDLIKSKEKVLGNKKIGRQTLASQALDCGLSQLYGLGYDFPPKLDKIISEVTPGDIQKFMERYFVPERQITVIVSPDG